jgi:copper transport protein
LPGVGLLLGAGHVLAMATWLGGLAYLGAVTLRRPPAVASSRSVGAAVATAPASTDPPDGLEASVRRFSSLALACVVTVVVTGVLQAWRVLEDGLFAGDYGRLLVIKTVLVAAMVVVAGLARRLVRRHWPAPGPLRQIVGAELALGVAVLGVTALLVGTSPSEAAAPEPFSTTLVQSDTIVSISVDPAQRGGGNAMHVYVTLPGSALRPVTGAEARLTLPSRDLGPIPVPLTAEGVNHFSAYDVQFPFAGEWELDVRVQTTPTETVRFTTPVPVGP